MKDLKEVKRMIKRSIDVKGIGVDPLPILGDALEHIEQLEERIAIMQEPVERKWYPKSALWECQGCHEIVRGIDKFCHGCGRPFKEEED